MHYLVSGLANWVLMSVAALRYAVEGAQGKVLILIDYSWALVAVLKVMVNAEATTTTLADLEET